MKVKELKAKTPVDEIELEIVSKAEARSFASAQGTGKVCSAAAKDEDGDEVSLTLWNEQIDEVVEGDKVKIEQGWVNEYQGNLQVSTGKFGKMTKL